MSDSKPADVARDEMISQVVGFTAYVLLAAGLSWAIANRDVLWRLKRRAEIKWRGRHADPYAREMAEFRRELADLNRGSDGSGITTRPTGLYER